jgi:hypothetical protein
MYFLLTNKNVQLKVCCPVINFSSSGDFLRLSVSLNQTPVIGPLKRRYFLRRTVEFYIGLLFPLTCDKVALSNNDFIGIQQLTICDLTEAIWALQRQSKWFFLCTALAGWLASMDRCVSFYGAH